MPLTGIAQVLRGVPKLDDPNLLVGIETADDAGVYRLTDDIALVQTLDFFPPVVDDPFIYGQIAAANALSDIYAMGAVAKTALNLVGYPDDQDPQLTWLGDILKGGAERCASVGVPIIGGHTVRDVEIKYGLSVTGVVHPKKVLTNATAKPGDKLVLTKPLGTGFITTAHKRGDCPDDLFRAACESMIQLNAAGCEAMIEVGVNAATDVTGFGLAGHGFEMAEGAGVTLVLNLSQLPLFPGVEKFARSPYRTRASATNAEYVGTSLRKEGNLDAVRLEFIFDPQTSGGLLISVAADRADDLVAACKERGTITAAVIGEVTERADAAMVVRE